MSRHSESEGFRPDIEGLRGIAVLLVVLFHAGLPVSGGYIGVDVFFVISGFLITGLLIRERERTGRVSFSRFYARRVRRLLPAALVVLLVTLYAASRLSNPMQQPSISLDGAAAALSFANVRFAMTTDYFTPAVTPSPFLHFWSLGVEEQFYLVWPALLAVAAWRKPRLGAGIALVGVLAVSFVACVVVTAAMPSWAFYTLPTRAWQLAAGGLLALPAGRTLRVPAPVRVVWDAALGFAGWAAVGLLIATAYLLDSNVAYPGTAALAPSLAGVVLIAAGSQRHGPGLLLRLSPIRFLGRISYSLYLWHWPILVLGAVAVGGSLALWQSVGLAAASVVVATLSWALVEEPFRRGHIPLPARPGRTVAVGLTAMLIVAVVGAGLNIRAETALAGLGGDSTGPIAGDVLETDAPTPAPTPDTTASTAPTARASASHGAAATASATATPPATPAPTPALHMPSTPPVGNWALTSAVHPSLASVRADYELPWRDGCLGSLAATTPPACLYGPANAPFTLALVGDSHASALFPAVYAVAKAHGWRLLALVKVSCPLLDIPIHNPDLKREYTECATWNEKVITRLNTVRPNLVLVSNSRWMFPENDADATFAREEQSWIRMQERIQSPVAIIQDIPLPYDDVPECLAAHMNDVRACAVPRDKDFGWNMGVREKAVSAATGAPIIDLTKAICPGSGACPVVINNMIVYRDGHHLTATFSTSLGPALDAQVTGILGRR